MYIHENHLSGNLYASEYPLDYEYLYCEQCGDSDWELGKYDLDSIDKLKEDMKDRGYNDEYIQEFIDEFKSELEEK